MDSSSRFDLGTCSEALPTTEGILPDYEYSHDETATVRLYSPTNSPLQTFSDVSFLTLNARIYLESSSTLRSTVPLFNQGDEIPLEYTKNIGTPFSKQVLDLISRYPLERLLIRVGDAATSRSSFEDNDKIQWREDAQQIRQFERARGPSGTSVAASFLQYPKPHHDDAFNTQNDLGRRSSTESLSTKYRNQYASLLRHLLDKNLFPPCGAPLDSARVRKHGHQTVVRFPIAAKSSPQRIRNIIEVESVLAADASSFCPLGVHSLLLSKGDNDFEEGWGHATNNGACHASDNWGLFDSLFGTPPLLDKSSSSAKNSQYSSAEVLSELLLGTSEGSGPWHSYGEIGGNGERRNSVWIDLEVTPWCFSKIPGKGNCTIKVTRGVSYRIALGHGLIVSSDTDEPDPMEPTDIPGGEKVSMFYHVSLGDLLVGNSALAHMLNKQGWEAWYPCPLSDSSKVVVHIPEGYSIIVENDMVSITGNGETHAKSSNRKLEINMLARKHGYMDLAAPLAKIFLSSIGREQSSAHYGISRTVQRPLGTAGSGTILSVLRYGQTTRLPKELVEVQSLDIIPGTVIKPRMSSLRMFLYRGNGAGDENFSPPLDQASCASFSLADESIESVNYKSNISCSIVRLSDLPQHNLILQNDGSIHFERIIKLVPDSSLWTMIDFYEAYLPFQKFPADANRGVDVVPSLATFTPLEMAEMPPFDAVSTTLYSPPLLILPPVPDMSMPFNVISLSCTVWAFVLGSLLNMLVRRGSESVKRELTGEKETRPIDKLKAKIREKKNRLKEKLAKLRNKYSANASVSPQEDIQRLQ
mmetsp:Transcript_1821/g.3691  ORF Transcript_1821/g.3691 Transcript_1821/m.3691 type:complete len:812 (-) Transcript_1821:1386-3821(-)